MDMLGCLTLLEVVIWGNLVRLCVHVLGVYVSIYSSVASSGLVLIDLLACLTVIRSPDTDNNVRLCVQVLGTYVSILEELLLVLDRWICWDV